MPLVGIIQTTDEERPPREGLVADAMLRVTACLNAVLCRAVARLATFQKSKLGRRKEEGRGHTS